MALAVMALCGCEKEDKGVDINQKHTSYTNALSELSLPDPCVIRGDDGYFYLYATEDVTGIPIMKSGNLIDWKMVGKVFPSALRPKLDGSQTGNLWAPDIAKNGDKYLLYYVYAPSSSSDGWLYGIGVCEADDPAGPWTDKGKVLLGSQVGVPYSIDPCFYSEGGKNYLIWGSYWGIWIIELTADGLSVKAGAEPERLAGVDGYGIEAAMIYKKDNYYYLLVSEGPFDYDYNHYKVGAYRATSLRGPYYNKAGNPALTSAPTFFLSGGNGFRCPGHNSEIITDDNGEDWMLYHAYIDGDPDGGRKLMLDHIVWESGWPSVEGGIPSATSTLVPYFK